MGWLSRVRSPAANDEYHDLAMVVLSLDYESNRRCAQCANGGRCHEQEVAQEAEQASSRPTITETKSTGGSRETRPQTGAAHGPGRQPSLRKLVP